jgi:hypothetical protein
MMRVDLRDQLAGLNVNRKALTFVKHASIRIMLRKLCNPR